MSDAVRPQTPQAEGLDDPTQPGNAGRGRAPEPQQGSELMPNGGATAREARTGPEGTEYRDARPPAARETGPQQAGGPGPTGSGPTGTGPTATTGAGYPDGGTGVRPGSEPEPAPNRGGGPGERSQGPASEMPSSLVTDATGLRRRWESVQVSFVDDPRQAVSDAEALVSAVIEDMTAGFRHQRQQLDSLWSQGHEASTEQLRQAIQRYRDFFERFLRV